jgi:hypothetical protein
MAGWPGIRVLRSPLLVFPDILQMEDLDTVIPLIGDQDALIKGTVVDTVR